MGPGQNEARNACAQRTSRARAPAAQEQHQILTTYTWELRKRHTDFLEQLKQESEGLPNSMTLDYMFKLATSEYHWDEDAFLAELRKYAELRRSATDREGSEPMS